MSSCSAVSPVAVLAAVALAVVLGWCVVAALVVLVSLLCASASVVVGDWRMVLWAFW